LILCSFNKIIKYLKILVQRIGEISEFLGFEVLVYFVNSLYWVVSESGFSEFKYLQDKDTKL